MSTSKSEIVSLIPKNVQYLFERLPLLKAEDPADYWKLVRHFISYVPPKAIIEWVWIRDVVDHTWEILRLRRFRAIIASSTTVYEDYYATMDGTEEQLARLEQSRDHEAESATRLVTRIKDYQVLDRLIASLERRRDRSLAQVDFSVAQRLRQAAAEIDNGKNDKPSLAAA